MFYTFKIQLYSEPFLFKALSQLYCGSQCFVSHQQAISHTP